MEGKALVKGLVDGQPLPRPPYIPLLGEVASKLAQVPAEVFTQDAQTHARALVECAMALGADAITVGVDTPVKVGVDAVVRMRPLAQGKAIAGVVASSDVAGVRAYCEAGVDLLFVVADAAAPGGRLRTVANACRFYRTPIILLVDGADDPAARAAEAQFDGAVVPAPTGDEAGIVGGGLSAAALGNGAELRPPRDERFFWSFGGQAPSDVEPEVLADLGSRLTA